MVVSLCSRIRIDPNRKAARGEPRAAFQSSPALAGVDSRAAERSYADSIGIQAGVRPAARILQSAIKRKAGDGSRHHP